MLSTSTRLWVSRRKVRGDQNQVKQEIEAIQREGRRLDLAADVLADRKRAAAEVERLKAPLATMKRWFSQEWEQATSRLEGLESGARRVGTTSEAELQEQQARWRREEARVPKLEEKAGELSRALEMVRTALDGLGREQEREFDWDLRRRRQRSRDEDRGR